MTHAEHSSSQMDKKKKKNVLPEFQRFYLIWRASARNSGISTADRFFSNSFFENDSGKNMSKKKKFIFYVWPSYWSGVLNIVIIFIRTTRIPEWYCSLCNYLNHLLPKRF